MLFVQLCTMFLVSQRNDIRPRDDHDSKLTLCLLGVKISQKQPAQATDLLPFHDFFGDHLRTFTLVVVHLAGLLFYLWAVLNTLCQELST